MAYSRIEVQDGVTIMNKKLYDNLQDGIDEVKEALKVLPASVIDDDEVEATITE